MGLNVTNYVLQMKGDKSIASGFDHATRTGDNTFSIYFIDGSKVDLTIPLPKDGKDAVDITDVKDLGNGKFTLVLSDGSETSAVQTIKGQKGDKGDKLTFNDLTDEEKASLKGDSGFSPTITENENNTDKIYKLDVTTADGTFTTPNLKGKDGSGSSTGEENVIESIKVNGVAQTVADDKSVDITVPTVDVDKNYVDTELAKKANTSDIPSLDGYAKTTEIPSKVSELENDSNYLSSIPEEYVTETELSAKGYLTEHQDISGKVDKVEGKSLISDTEIARLATVDNYDDTDIKAEIANKADATAIPSKVSELTNDSNYQTAEQVNSTVTTEIAKVVADAPEDLNTLKEMSDWIAGHEDDASAMNSAISDNKTAITALQTGKADKSEIPTTVAQLTDSADYAKKTDLHSHENKSVLDGITSDKVTAWDNKSEFSGSYNDLNDKPTIDAELSNTSENAIQNKVVTKEINKLYSDISFNDFDTATDGISFTDAEDGNMLVTDWTRNLLNPTLETTEQNGVTCTNNGDGTYTLNGTASGNAYFVISGVIYDKNIINKYEGSKLVGAPSGSSYESFFLFAQFNGGQSTQKVYNDYGNGIKLNNIKGYETLEIIICVISGKTVSNLTFKPMLTTDLEATYDDFVPYSGYDIKTCGKNLLDPNAAGTHGSPYTENGITFTKNNDGSWTINGTATYNAGISIGYPGEDHTFIELEADAKAFLFGSSGVSGLAYGFYTNESKQISNNENIPKGTKIRNLWISCYKGNTFNNVKVLGVISYDLNLADTMYVPYQDGGTVHIDSTTEFPLLGLKSFDGITNIISPGNVKCVYPTNESGKGVLDSLYNKDKMLTEQNKSLEVLGKCKNLLKPTLKTTTQNGVTCTANGDGTYTLNGTSTDMVTFIVQSTEDLSKKHINEDLWLVGCPKNGSMNTYKLQFWSASNKVAFDFGSGAKFRIENSEYGNIAIRIETGVTVNNLVFKPMLTTNLNATYDDFVPYTGDGETLASDVAEIKKDLGGLSFSASGTTLSITDGTNTWTLEANS